MICWVRVIGGCSPISAQRRAVISVRNVVRVNGFGENEPMMQFLYPSTRSDSRAGAG